MMIPMCTLRVCSGILAHSYVCTRIPENTRKESKETLWKETIKEQMNHNII